MQEPYSSGAASEAGSSIKKADPDSDGDPDPDFESLITDYSIRLRWRRG